MGTGNAADQATFINAVVPWLEDQDFIKKYAAFGRRPERTGGHSWGGLRSPLPLQVTFRKTTSPFLSTAQTT